MEIIQTFNHSREACVKRILNLHIHALYNKAKGQGSKVDCKYALN